MCRTYLLCRVTCTVSGLCEITRLLNEAVDGRTHLDNDRQRLAAVSVQRMITKSTTVPRLLWATMTVVGMVSSLLV